MLAKVKEYIDRHHLLTGKDKVLAACSGGPDSLALTHILFRLRNQYDLDLAVAHVDHMLRDDESVADARFVAEFCREFGLVCYSAALNVPRFIARTNHSGEEAARLLRYNYLRAIAGQMGGAKIATGHHRDDQVETVLINLLRGAGSAGLKGIEPVNGNIIRPLLGVTRAEIDEYCRVNGLSPRVDRTNFATDYLRNRVRMELLPLLERRYNSGIREHLGNLAAIAGAEHDFIKTAAARVQSLVSREGEDGRQLKRAEFLQLPVALQREVIRSAIEAQRGDLRGISFLHVEKLIALLTGGRVGSIYELPGNLVARREYDGITLRTGSDFPSSPPPAGGRELIIPGVTSLGAAGPVITAEIGNFPGPEDKRAAVFAWEALAPPVFVRHRLPGDRFQPAGMKGTKKLKDYFIDAKIPRARRDKVLIFYDLQGIIWLGGLRQAQRGTISGPANKKMLRLTIDNGEEKHD